MSGRLDAGMRLERALAKHAMLAGISLAIGETCATRWASATFAGARHRIVLTADGPSAREWLSALGEADLPLHGHLVADLATLAARHDGPRSTATIEVLTVEQG